MKRLSEITSRELANFNYDQIRELLQVELKARGIKMPFAVVRDESEEKTYSEVNELVQSRFKELMSEINELQSIIMDRYFAAVSEHMPNKKLATDLIVPAYLKLAE
jgi:hypothetical protein